ncbi:MAG: hypothetical protein QM484_05425 [Woeseiaceae bacterium]
MSTRLPIILIIFMIFSSLVTAEVDPMKSLFIFQQQMADKGRTSAMMKVGEMYERGEGVKQSHGKALEMYKKAQAAGEPKAKGAIRRIQLGKSNSSKKKQAQKEKLRKRGLAAEKLQKKRKAEKLEAAKAKVVKDREFKARESKAKESKARTLKLREAKIKTIKAREAMLKAREAKARIRATKARTAKIKAAKAKRKSTATKAVKNKENADIQSKGFKLDPCKGKAARLLSICRRK